jgi:hypothetical protein
LTFEKLQAGDYVWETYEQIYEKTVTVGSAMRHVGLTAVSKFYLLEISPRAEIVVVGTIWLFLGLDMLAFDLQCIPSKLLNDNTQDSRCGIYGPNSPEWFTAMEVMSL